MLTLRFAQVATSIGPMWIAETDAGVAAASRSPTPEAFLAGLARRFGTQPIADAVDAEWVASATTGGPLPPVDLGGLPTFDAAVYAAVRGIPAGETMTYGEVAAAVGAPRAARAVGNALARCPLFPAVPCQRVVRAADGWSGWGGDVGLKRRLLRVERARRPV